MMLDAGCRMQDAGYCPSIELRTNGIYHPHPVLPPSRGKEINEGTNGLAGPPRIYEYAGRKS